MHQGTNRRLANLKTRAETGFDYVVSGLGIQTPFGKRALKDQKPFFPGNEEELRQELDRVEKLRNFYLNSGAKVARLSEQFMCLKNIDSTLERSRDFNLSEVEIFEVKSLLLYSAEIEKILRDEDVPDEFVPVPMEELLDILDPKGDGINTFYLYDEYSEQLTELRREKKQIDLDVRKIRKARKALLLQEHGIALTPKFDIVIPRSSDDLEKARTLEELEAVGEDYVSVTFALSNDAETFKLIERAEEIEGRIEEEEVSVRKMLSEEIGRFSDTIYENCLRIGRLDMVLAKAEYAVKHNCSRPAILDEHRILIEAGRQPEVEAVLKAKGKEYCPIDMELTQGVVCITGANMGGKTISLKLAGLVPLLAQYGYFVPAERAEVGLSNFIQILIGDSQSVERGLSSFGSEMEELKEILDHADDRSLILIDEIASGTNPVEGLALTKSLVEHFLEKPYITLITTHFETVTEARGVRNLQVRGLAGADFNKLDRELKRANRRERIEIIGKYMDYSLEPVSGDREIPKDALNIAKMLGIPGEIIEGARKYIK